MFQNVFGYAAPYFRVRNAQQGIIIETKGGFTNDFKSNIDVDLPNGTEDVSFFEHIEIAPNPTPGNTYFRFDLKIENGSEI